jgi:putative component of membrane protein insertase Oxa1/YidC/SpoIIIJ protein YidD
MTFNQKSDSNSTTKDVLVPSFLGNWLVALIECYQKRGGGSRVNVECNFIPSCSHYTKQAVEKKGVVKGLVLGFKRIKRCNQPDLVHKIEDPLV